MALCPIKLFACNANKALASRVAHILGVNLADAEVSHFSDGETMIDIKENVRGCDTFIIQSLSYPTNDNLMALMLMVDALRRSSAGSITAVVPYLGYSRQDRRPRSSRVPISAKVVADMLQSVGIKRLITVDLHADQIQGFYTVPVDNVYSSPVFLEDIRHQIDDLESLMVFSPDVGGVVRARAVAKRLDDADLGIIDKRRPAKNEVEVMHVVGDPKGKHCILIDDIVDTSNTLCKAAESLKQAGAASIVAYCTHAILSGNALEVIEHSALDALVITDTITAMPEVIASSKTRILSLDELLAKTIMRVNRKESVSSMFLESEEKS